MTLLHQTDAFVQRISKMSGAHYTIVYEYVHALVAHLLFNDEHLDGVEYAFLRDFYAEDSSYDDEVEEASFRKPIEPSRLTTIPWFVVRALDNGMSAASFMHDLSTFINAVVDAAPSSSGARHLGSELLAEYGRQVEEIPRSSSPTTPGE